MRSETLGNNIYDGDPFYVRDDLDEDGSDYNLDDIDEEYFTVKVYDETGWSSYLGCLEEPDNCSANTPVYKRQCGKTYHNHFYRFDPWQSERYRQGKPDRSSS